MTDPGRLQGGHGPSRQRRTYHIVTFGCQMNKADSERVAAILEKRDLRPVDTVEAADVVVFMTCCVREKADERLYGQVASLGDTDKLICIGGCIGERDGERLKQALPNVDLVFGTAELQADFQDQPKREHSWSAWLPIITGCNNFCSYCIVPYVRGRETSRPFEDVVAAAEALVADGVQEITLLGQNVNSYGRDLYGQPRFAELLRAVAATGIPRIRFTTSHPKDLSDATITAFAELPAVMPALHFAVQSGSDRILEDMGRHYTRSQYLELVRKLRQACLDSGKGRIALSTDIIVGYPGEREQDFQDTLDLVREVGYHQAFTFIYSKREGTRAAQLVDDTPHEIIQERFDRLVEAVQTGAYAQNQLDLDSDVAVLFEGASKRDPHILAGKSPKNQTVHVPLPEGQSVDDFTGRILDVHIDQAKTWYLKGTLL
jgi:tRNA-2-methylthio-N6-dimethylallyladenosine synthase